MSAGFVVEGEEEMMAKLQRLFPMFKDAAAQGMADWGMDVIATSQRDYVPVDTGALKASGHTSEVTITDTSLSMELGYSANYAMPVHENTTARHEVGQAKFLEIPLIVKSAELLPRVVKAMDSAAEGL